MVKDKNLQFIEIMMAEPSRPKKQGVKDRQVKSSNVCVCTRKVGETLVYTAKAGL